MRLDGSLFWGTPAYACPASTCPWCRRATNWCAVVSQPGPPDRVGDRAGPLFSFLEQLCQRTRPGRLRLPVFTPRRNSAGRQSCRFRNWLAPWRPISPWWWPSRDSCLQPCSTSPPLGCWERPTALLLSAGWRGLRAGFQWSLLEGDAETGRWHHGPWKRLRPPGPVFWRSG